MMNSGSNRPSSNYTGMWVNFFTAAGIPPDVAATYALTFTENRIQSDMLLDLNKEYLRDMGISRMGDVIAILRHAKQVHESAARDRVLSTAAASNKVPVAAVAGRTTAQAKTSPASRILEHYTRNTSGPDVSPTTSPSHKRKSVDTGTDTEDIKKSRLIRFAAPPQPQPESVQEGPSKVTVFARLGNTETVKTPPANPPAKPIFARLGAKTDATPDNVIPMQKDALKYEGILKSKAVKKVVTVTTSKNNERKIAMTCTMRADETPISIKEKLLMPKAKSVKFSNHVQYKEIEGVEKERVVSSKALVAKSTAVFNKPERRLTMPETPKLTTTTSGIKARLGSKSSNNLTITSGRLGL